MGYDQISEYAETQVEFYAKHLISTTGFTNEDREDIEQDLRLRLLERFADYDEGKCSLKSYLARIIKWHIGEMKRDKVRKSEAINGRVYSLNEDLSEENDNSEPIRYCDLVDIDKTDIQIGKRNMTAEQMSRLKFEVKELLELLPDELKIVAESLKTQNSKETAKKLNISYATLKRYKKGIKSLFRKNNLNYLTN